MRKFIVRFFAVIGFIVTLVVVLGVAVSYRQQKALTQEPENVILTLDFDKPIVEENQSSPLDLALHEEAVPLLDVIHAIDQARLDPHVKGIVAHFSDEQPELAQAQEIRDAVARFRESKKFTYAYASDYGSFGLGNRTYYLASAFENIWLQPVGSVSLTGLAIEQPFGKSALDKIGVTADFMQRKEYKSFMEMAQRDDFSPPVRANMQSMIDDMSDQISGGIAQSRGWDQARVKELMTQGPFTDKEAMKAGLITHLGYEDELNKEVLEKAGDDAKQADVEEYLAYEDGSTAPEPKAKVALIYGTGLIVGKATSGPADIGGEHVMGADDISDAFNSAIEDKSIKAILFRIDSPGGTPEASETIRRSVIHAQEEGKPVFVSMGSTAASGGYWIAMNADRIIAEPGTITGSIGVLSGKFDISGLAQKLGVHFDGVRTADNAGMWSMAQAFTPAQRDRVNAMLDQTYQEFTENVSTARRIPMERMDDIAKGRVWTGAQASKLGLVDDLGGYGTALAAIRKKLGLDEKDILSLEQFPAPETPVEKVMKLLHGLSMEDAMVRSALTEWQGLQAALPFLGDFSAFNRPVSAQMPRVFTQGAR